MIRPIILGAAAATLQACFLVTDFDVEGTSSGTAGSSQAAGGQGGAAGGGGAMTCENADLSSDENHCGTCGFGCGSAECIAGLCAETIDLSAHGANITTLVIKDDTLFFVQRNTDDTNFMGALRTLPVDFTNASTPELEHPITNSIGGLVLGTQRVYFAGQQSKTIYACNEVECIEVSLGAAIQTQVNGMTVIDQVLYLVAAAPDNRLLSIPLDAGTGVPSVNPTYLVSDYSPAIVNAGVLQLFHLLSPVRLFWASHDNVGTQDGCIYRIETANVPAGPLPCWSPSFMTMGFVVASDGTVFGQNGAATVVKIAGEPPTITPFATNAAHPRAIDADYLYVTNDASKAIRAIPLDGGTEAPETAVPPANPIALVATHPRYLYYSAGSTIVRWPKPIVR